MSGTAFELGDTIVKAGAGAGKTRGLVEKVVDVFKRSGGEARVVITTFTRKATQELKERLIFKACSDEDAALLQYVSDPNRLQIATIHGLLNVFLKQIGHLADLDSGFNIISEFEGQHMARLALREAVLRQPEFSHFLEVYGFSRLLGMCRAFQTHRREAPGGLEPASVEDLAAARAEARARWARRFGETAASILEQTEDAAWTEYANGLDAFFNNWDGEPAGLEALPTKPRMSKKYADLQETSDGVQAELKKFREDMGSACWNSAFWPAFIEEWNAFQPLAREFDAELTRVKNAQARFEMIDLELKALEILRDKPYLGAIFSEEWDFWMIDEYQDTSPLQVEILEKLIAAKPKYRVGDPQQSIYLFRGAEVRVFDQALEETRAAGGEVVELKQNWRTRPDLLLWINDYMVDVSKFFKPMEARVLEGEVAREGAGVVLLRAPDETVELKNIAARIEELLAGGARLEEICILGRTHRTLMDVSRALKELGYPTHVQAARGFNSRREVLDAQALWTFLVNPHDNLNLLILLRSPWFFTEDSKLSDEMQTRPQSLWRKFAGLSNVPESVLRLRQALAEAERSGLARAFEATLIANGILDLSLHNDPAGRKESNLWKLILRARALEKESSKSILGLNEGDADSALEANEGDATSAQEPNCINLMTIHGSKGLEFEHVILPRMGESPRPSSTLALSADRGRFFFPIWNEGEKEFTASPLDRGVTARKRERELEEFDRWLYVALTRAKNTLTLTWVEAKRDSWASRSSWTVKPAGPGRTANYAFEVREEMPEPTPYRARAGEEKAPRAPFASAPAVRGDRSSVTELIEKGPKLKERNDGDEILNRWAAQSLGTRIHRALEAAKYGRELELEGAEGESVRYVLNSASPPLAAIMAAGESEWGFQVRTPSRVVEGQIDLFGEFEGVVYVVDYKTGSPKRKEDAFRQLSLYAWALRKFGETKPIALLVTYPLLKKSERRDFDQQLFLFWEVEFGDA